MSNGRSCSLPEGSGLPGGVRWDVFSKSRCTSVPGGPSRPNRPTARRRCRGIKQLGILFNNSRSFTFRLLVKVNLLSRNDYRDVLPDQALCIWSAACIGTAVHRPSSRGRSPNTKASQPPAQDAILLLLMVPKKLVNDPTPSHRMLQTVSFSGRSLKLIISIVHI